MKKILILFFIFLLTAFALVSVSACSANKPSGTNDSYGSSSSQPDDGYDFKPPSSDNGSAGFDEIRHINFLDAEGNLYKEYTFMYIKDLKMPPVPEIFGYDGEWSDFSDQMNEKYITVKPVYTPKIYYVYFTNGETVIKKCQYTLENRQIDAPEVPQMPYMRGVWEDYTSKMSGCDVYVSAVYCPIDYYVYFYDGETLIDKVAYNVFSTDISEPEIPKKNGAIGKWKEYKSLLTGGDVLVNTEYEYIEYKIFFYAETGATPIAEAEYSLDNFNFKEPSVPEKFGYTTGWEEYRSKLTGGNVHVYAVYTLISYSVCFYTAADKAPIHISSYTVENKLIAEPAVPVKDGAEGVWEEYKSRLTGGNVNVYAVYFTSADNFIWSADGCTVLGYSGIKEDIVVPSRHNGKSVTAIANQAFYKNDKIRKVTVAEGVTRLDDMAFAGCPNLEYVSLPESVTEIGSDLFQNCSALKEAKIASKISSLPMRTFYMCISLEKIAIPDSLKEINLLAFGGCEKLIDIRIPEGVYNIEKMAFMNCSNLQKIVFGAGLKCIEPEAFKNCNAITNVTFALTYGWRVTNPQTMYTVVLNESQLSDALQNATILKGNAANEFYNEYLQ